MIGRIQQVKVPVTDLVRSAAWYRRVFERERLLSPFSGEGPPDF